MTIEEAMGFIHSVKWRGSKPGLSRTRELLRRLDNPETGLKFVHIAGTNGKGSTAAFIEAVLRRSGYKTGLYTSPYINRFNERMRVNGEEITDEELINLVERIMPEADSMRDKPTEFEIITALAMLWFYRQRCEIVVLETGMGGELDSTNVISVPEAAVITAMGFDHVRELGPTMSDIAEAKAGIIKENGRVVIYGENPEAEAVFERVCRQRGAKLFKADFSKLHVRETGLWGSLFDYEDLTDLRIPMAGVYQPKNAAVAVSALKILRDLGYCITDEDIKTGLSEVSWPGRFEVLGWNPVFLLDGAHNPQGMESLTASLNELFPGRKIVFVSGAMRDKDICRMGRIMAGVSECCFTVTPDNSRSLPSEELAEIFISCGIEAYPCRSINEGVAGALVRAGESGIICAAGSLYFSADIRKAYKDCISIAGGTDPASVD